MLLLFYLHIFITIISSFGGFLFYLFLNGRNASNKPLIFYPVMGLIVVTLISQVAVLFIPINAYFSGSLICVMLFLCVLKKRDTRLFLKRVIASFQTLSVTAILFIGIAWLMVLSLNAGPIIMDDTDSYHLQMVKWIQEYGSVPGIANLHERFGFNSSWFSSISSFSPFQSHHNLYTVLNGAISFWLSAFFIWQLNSIIDFKKSQRIYSSHIAIIVVLVTLIFSWPMLRGNATNANYDFITTAIILILFLKTVQADKQTGSDIFCVEWIIWPVYLFTVRIINYPLLLLSVYGLYFLLKNRAWKKIIVNTVVCLLLVLPFMARNVILTGYPFYPATFGNIFNVDWKADYNIIKKLQDYIKYFNRVNTAFADINQTKKLSTPGWITSWFHYLFRYDKVVVVAALAGYLLNLLSIKRFLAFNNKSTKFLALVFCLQLVSWMWIAPDPRFVNGELLSGIMLLVILLVGNKSYYQGKIKATHFLIALFIGILSYTSFKIIKNENYQRFLLPYKIPQPPIKEVIVDNISLKIPEKIFNNWNPRCYATELPCLYIVNPKLRARGKSIENGFRLEK